MAEEAAPPSGWRRMLARVDGFAQRHAWIAFPYGVVKKTGEDKGSYLAALVAYYGFFSIFPLLLVFVTILGYVLAGNPDLRTDIVDTAFAQIPVLGDDSVNALEGNLFALVFGSVTALWAGLGALQAMEHAMNTVWGVPIKARPNFLFSRLRAVAMLGVVGIGIIGVTVLGASTSSTGAFGPGAKVVGAAAALALAVGVFLLSFIVLTHCDLPVRAHIPGAVVGGALFVVLQIASGFYVDRVIKDAEATYGVFATVIGLLSWMYLQAQIAVYAAEVNVVRHSRLWPRSLPGGTLTEADRRSLQEHAEVEERIDGEEVHARINGAPARSAARSDGPSGAANGSSADHGKAPLAVAVGLLTAGLLRRRPK
jgi:YihY family inner membrane protein